MKKAVLAIAAATMLGLGISAPAAPAFAQGWYDDAPPPPRWGHERRDRDWRRDRDRDSYGRPRMMGPREIARSLERRGYNVGDIDMRRGTYYVKASRHGRRLILIVDARDGRILDTQRVGGGRPHRTGFTIEVNP
ncbi:antifreeze protein [Brucella sp. IR073]|uniref:antifreeze protein n=1 Tax=unclassified Brucella TaxID=2632610 RepID=UPI003B984D2D